METIQIIAITLFVYWSLGFIIFWATKENETFAALWAMGLVYALAWLLCAPYRIIRKAMRNDKS